MNEPTSVQHTTRHRIMKSTSGGAKEATCGGEAKASCALISLEYSSTHTCSIAQQAADAA